MKNRKPEFPIVITAIAVVLLWGLHWVGRFKGSTDADIERFFPHFHLLIRGLSINYYALSIILCVIVIGYFLYFFSVLQQFIALLNRYSKEIAICLVAIAIPLLISEFVLRKVVHMRPGYYVTNQWVNEVKELKLLKGLEADSTGIFKVSPQVASEIGDYIARDTTTHNRDGVDVGDSLDISIYSSIYLAECIISGDEKDSFAQYYRQLNSKPVDERNDLENAVVEFTFHPYNQDGFRSIPFRNYKSGKKKILLLGDSFTWGGCPSVISNSFADLLLTKGYAVYNTGITGTDPEQYRAVAKKYIPLLKPDVVIVNLYTGNDIANFERPVIPFEPVYFPTNAGNLMTFFQGSFFKNAQEAYCLSQEAIQIPANRSWFNHICSKTCITTLFWAVLKKKGWLKYPNSESLDYHNQLAEKTREPAPACQRIISGIKQTCIENGAQFVYLQIPELKINGLSLPGDFEGFADTIPHFIPPVTAKDYTGIGGHLNDAGHKKYAEFIDALIDSLYPVK